MVRVGHQTACLKDLFPGWGQAPFWVPPANCQLWLRAFTKGLQNSTALSLWNRQVQGSWEWGQSIWAYNQVKGHISEKVNSGSFYQLAIPHKDKIYLLHCITSNPERLSHSSKMNTAAPESGTRVGQTSWKGRGADMPPANPDVSLKYPHILYKEYNGSLSQFTWAHPNKLSSNMNPKFHCP